MTAGPLTGYLAERDELVATATPGTHAARSLADLTDRVVSALAGAALPALSVPVSIFALGGYGAHRLLPHSDIDLLVISPGGSRELDPLVRALLYPLWDAGLTVGHQVRPIKGHVRALGEDVANLTSFLTARFVCGDRRGAERALAESFRRLGKDAARARREILRRNRPGSPYLLEPDLKEGTGGQRDIDELVWHAALASGVPARDAFELLTVGLLDSAELDALGDAQDAITAARWALHARAGRGRNLLGTEDAAEAGVDADAAQRALAVVAETLVAVRERLEGTRAEGRLAPLTLRDLRSAALAGPAALPDLERAAWRCQLDTLAPGFSELMTLRRPALSHRLTVGAHCLAALTLLARPQTEATGHARSGASQLPDSPLTDALVVAALAHDLGKRQAGAGHAERGVADAHAIALRAGLDPEAADTAGVLVREHLLLSEVASHADLSDEDVVLTAAVRLGDARLVRPLFLLTAADMQATGPDVWTPWRAALVGDLAAKMEAALSPEVDGAGIVAAAEATRVEARRRASSVGASRTVLAFLEHAPLRYLARRTATEVLRDARLVQSLGGPGRIGEFAFEVQPGPAAGTWLLDVVTRDRAGLFATISGVLALTGLDVLSAEAFTEQAGVALDTFTVASATRADIGPGTWTAFETRLDDALSGRLDLEARLAERRRHYAPRQNGATPPEVRVGPRGVFSTSVHVRAADRVGLLHDLAFALERAGLDVRRAVITTESGIARDTFEVTDEEGAPPDPALVHDTLVPLLGRVACG
ncbi:MAG: hypothetical protein JXP72_07375 [Coriobacteriia bacterium]|nr:hypothetical protein [Coriobacteriia bacterium]